MNTNNVNVPNIYVVTQVEHDISLAQHSGNAADTSPGVVHSFLL